MPNSAGVKNHGLFFGSLVLQYTSKKGFLEHKVSEHEYIDTKDASQEAIEMP